MKMPVKVDSSRCRSPTPFDCDMLTEFEQELVNDLTCLSNFDDMWGNLTPPASPQMKLDLMDLNLDNLLDDESEEMDFEAKLINHDCMWSGQCSEGHCNSSAYSKPTNSSNSLSSSWSRTDVLPGSCFNLSTSPITNLLGDLTYSDFAGLESLSSFLEDDLASPQPQLLQQQELQMQQQQQLQMQMQQQQQVTQQSGNVFAGMANDHSYESSSPVSIKEESEDEIVIKKESSKFSSFTFMIDGQCRRIN